MASGIAHSLHSNQSDAADKFWRGCDYFKKRSPACLFRTIFAGAPYAKTLAGRERVTNDPDPTTVFSPMLTLSKIVAPKQTAAYFPILTKPPSTEPADTLANSSITQSCSIWAPVPKSVKSPILAPGLKMTPAIAMTPDPISTLFPMMTDGWMALTNLNLGIREMTES